MHYLWRDEQTKAQKVLWCFFVLRKERKGKNNLEH
jgi:hypothetical protein